MPKHQNVFIKEGKPRQIGYLSGAPLVSTDPKTPLSGPRTHVLGIIHSFESQGWQVRRFIAGDQFRFFTKLDRLSFDKPRQSGLKVIVKDLVRLMLGIINLWLSRYHLGSSLVFVYERLSAFQALGRSFQRRGVPWVLETNALNFKEADADRNNLALTWLAKRIEIQAYRRCDVLVVISQSLKNLVIENAKVDPDKILVLPNAVDVNVFKPLLQPSVPQNPDVLTIGFIGNVAPWQGLDILLAALASALQQNVYIKVLIVGDGIVRAGLQSQSDALALQEYVEFVGHVSPDEIPQWIERFDVGFSGQSTFQIGIMYASPIKLYEYMAMAKPLLATRHEDVQALQVFGAEGFFYEPGDINTLATLLVEMYQQRDAIRKMGTHNRQIVINHHTWSHRATHLLQFMIDKGYLQEDETDGYSPNP